MTSYFKTATKAKQYEYNYSPLYAVMNFEHWTTLDYILAEMNIITSTSTWSTSGYLKFYFINT